MSSLPRIRASRANGALSRGPKTPEGKCRAAGNHCTHGFYSTCILLKSESPDHYAKFCQKFHDSLQPNTEQERQAVDRIAAAKWQLDRLHEKETRLLNQHLPANEPDNIKAIVVADEPPAATIPSTAIPSTAISRASKPATSARRPRLSGNVFEMVTTHPVGPPELGS